MIRAYREYRGICDDVYYWAPSGRSETEIDFLLVQGKDFIAVEAKSGNNFMEVWCKGLRAVSQLEGLKRRIIVYPGGSVLRTQDGIEVLPFQQFAELLAGESLWNKY